MQRVDYIKNIDEISDIISSINPNRVAIITHEHLLAEYPQILKTWQEYKSFVVPVKAGEGSKNLTQIGEILEELATADFHRDGLVIGFGGGVITDIAGFVAAIYMRGVRFLAIPTTLLGMVDAALGGKNGVNLAAGKNLAGTFWLPISTVIYPEFIKSLPPNEIKSGLAEVAKYGFIANPAILDLLKRKPLDFNLLIKKSIKVKLDITSSDLREQSKRMSLNYGHTFGHGIEIASNYKLSHGESIAVGMMFAAHLANSLGKLSAAEVIEHKTIFNKIGLPISVDENLAKKALPFMAHDKKASGKNMRFVLLNKIGEPEVVEGISIKQITQILPYITKK